MMEVMKHEIASPHPEEFHRSHRAGWLRAAVLGFNDGIVSNASLMLGVIAAARDSHTVMISGVAGLVAGALSMAAGEYVSVSSQRDSEKADIDIEARSIKDNPKEELAELAHIYRERGLDADLAQQVAEQLHAKNAVLAHARDELGIDHDDLANPMQAAIASALAFSLGAVVPIFTFLAVGRRIWPLVIVSLVALGISGAVGAYIGGGRKLWAAARVLIGGGIAMAATILIGQMIGGAV